MLHFTNGTSVTLSKTGIGGEIVPWLDALHEGPAPAGLGLDELSGVRAEFLDAEFPEFAPTLPALRKRDAALKRFRDHEEVALWFEHDLYDQLQLIQILDWLGERRDGAPRLSLICVDQYLGRLNPQELLALWPERREVTARQFELAARGWRAFRSPDPGPILELLQMDTSCLPFLAGAFLRHLEQFPSIENGLSRTEAQILQAASAGAHSFESLFAADQKMEERLFMGDRIFQGYLRRLASCRVPLLHNTGTLYEISEAGRTVCEGRSDHIHLNGIDRWLGGVRLAGAGPHWRWDARSSKAALR